MPSVVWKIKKKSCFQLYFSSLHTFFIGLMNVQNFSLQREGRCRIYYTNAEQVVILQSGSSECYHGPDSQALLTVAELPELPWNPQVRIRWASWRAAEHSHPSSRLSLRSLHSLRLGTTQQWQQAEGGDLTSHTCTSARASQAESPGVLRWEAFQVQTHTVPSRMRRWRAPQWWVLVWPHWYSPFYQYYKAGGGGEALI